ncbi:MAG: LamG domain-containing protein [Nostoc sp.]|uniref:LamG domain-containing protein n=1 Tax=Nostoc sp. TaxID=1180 RepID=UPI002FFCEC97
MPLYNENDSGLVLPVETRTTAIDGDYVFMIDATTNIPYRITKANLLAGLSSSGSGGTSGGSGGSSGMDTYFSNVVLLLNFDGSNGSNVFTDIKGHTFTANGATLSTAQFKHGSSSGLFSNNSISTSNSSDFDFNSGSTFTIESWVYRLASGVSHAICGKLPQVANQGFSFHVASDDVLSFESDGASPHIESGLTVPINQWVYVAVAHSGSNYTFAVNSTTATISNSTSWSGSSNGLYVGENGRNDAYSAYFNGYIDDLRITNGIARDISTVPTAAFPNS